MERPDQTYAPIHAVARHRFFVDGEGVTTLVTFYGCLLHCKYCLNRKTLGPIPEGCKTTPQELYERVRLDEPYFLATNGGITFGGGEPCFQHAFIREFRQLCGDKWQLRIETSLNVPPTRVRLLEPVVNQWIVDVKTMDETSYLIYTRTSNRFVLTNLQWFCSQGLQDKVLIRLPIIPGYVSGEQREESKRKLQEMGFTKFDLFTYKIPHNNERKGLVRNTEVYSQENSGCQWH